MGETFDALATAGVIDSGLAGRLRRAVGFRNLAVHNYEVIDWQIVFALSSSPIADFEDFARAVVTRLATRPA